MRHDSQQGEHIGFWFHLGFSAMYVLAFAWHIKGAVEHARDMKRETPFEHLKRNADAFTHDVIRRHNPDAFVDVHIGQFADHDPEVGKHIDHCVKTGDPFFGLSQHCVEVFNRKMKAEGSDIRRWFPKGEGRPTLEDLQEENRLERLNGKRSNRDI